mmetsp:Transcript_5520/g.16298  ORF Transcript_5520/g.16298 Transcript_5520/m.16298 type:complete len:230 (-) Transcript_5520:273-962(-)
MAPAKTDAATRALARTETSARGSTARRRAGSVHVQTWFRKSSLFMAAASFRDRVDWERRTARSRRPVRQLLFVVTLGSRERRCSSVCLGRSTAARAAKSTTLDRAPIVPPARITGMSEVSVVSSSNMSSGGIVVPNCFSKSASTCMPSMDPSPSSGTGRSTSMDSGAMRRTRTATVSTMVSRIASSVHPSTTAGASGVPGAVSAQVSRSSPLLGDKSYHSCTSSRVPCA